MFLRNKKQQLPSYIEGTQGRYVRRASPPPVPSLTSHNIAKKSVSSVDVNANSNVPTTISSSPGSYSNHNQDSTPRKLSSSSYIPAEPSYISPSPPSSSLQPQLSHGSSRHLLVHQPHVVDVDEGKRSPQPGSLSSHSFNDPRRDHPRKPLTTSHSIGNVESFMDHLEPSGSSTCASPAQQRFVSLQNLPGGGRAFGSSIIGDDCLVSGSPQQDDLPLPDNWAIEVTPQGLRYYVDHNTCRTHWIHPLAHENLPPGWRKMFTEQGGVLYFNELDGRSQVEHPGLAAPISRTESMLVASRRAESAVEHLNIIQQEEVPEWLMIYSQADTDLDHLLEWNMFNTLQLESFEYMMMKLYKQEVIDTVRRYERMRTVLNREIVRRTQPRPPEN